MTFRSVLLGLLGAVVINAFTYASYAVLHVTNPVAHHLPVGVYGSLIIFILIINPLLFLIWKRLSLSGPEIAVALAIVLASCAVPGSSMMRSFTTSLVMPYQVNRTNPGWAARPVGKPMLERLPRYMLADVTPQNENDVLNKFMQGSQSKADIFTFIKTEIPWGAWKATLAFWLPGVFFFWIAALGISLVVHRQWADHEQLPYPIATFANAIIPEGKEVIPSLFKTNLFWIGLAVVLLIHLVNYANVWNPKLIPIPVNLELGSLTKLFPTYIKGGGWVTFIPHFLFVVIAFAYFIPADVSLALGIGPMLWFYFNGALQGYGVSMGAGYSNDPAPTNFMMFGSYFAMLLVLLYTGRQFYAAVFRRAIGLSSDEHVPHECVWGGRVFLVATGALVIYLSTVGKLDWQLSILFVGLCFLILVVMTRVVVETGLFFIQANFLPTAVILGIFGPLAVGPQSLLLLVLYLCLFMIDPKETLMPYMLNALKVLDMRKVNTGRVVAFGGLALILGVAVALPTTLYFQYKEGVNAGDAWSATIVPGMPFDAVVKVEDRLKNQGQLDEAARLDGVPMTGAVNEMSSVAWWQRGWWHFTHMMPNTKVLPWFLIGLGMVLLFTLGRLRFPKWPVHPVMFLFWTTFPALWIFPSFLVGWLVRTLVTRFGGGTAYRQMRPLMFGLAAGEIIGAVIPLFFGWFYYLHTGEFPKAYNALWNLSG
jgi:hypothetical protein